MTNREQAKMTMYSGLEAFVTKPANEAILDLNVPFLTEKTKYIAVRLANTHAAAKTGTDNSGFSQEKLDAKIAAGKRTAILAGFANVKLDDDGEIDLANQLHVNVTDYTKPADSDAAALMQGAHDLMKDNVGLLTGYVTLGNLADLQTLINTYTGKQGSSDSAHQLEPVDTAAFKASFAPVDKSIDKLLLLGRFLIDTTNEDLYNQLVAVTNIPAVNVHHTLVSITLRKKEDNSIIANGAAGLSNTTKASVRDFDGIITFEQVKSGPGVIVTATAPGRKQTQVQIAIERGRDNNFDIMMEAE